MCKDAKAIEIHATITLTETPVKCSTLYRTNTTKQSAIEQKHDKKEYDHKQ